MAKEATVEIAYVPFKTFLTALDTLKQGVPDPVDRSVFRSQSFSTQAMLISAFKALGALDEGGHPQPVLQRLIDEATRRAALREVLESRYRAVLDLGLAASEKQFDDTFAAYGVAGDTRKKAKSFFLQAAGMVGLPLSPHIPGVRTINENGDGVPPKPTTTRRRRTNRPKPPVGGGAGDITPPGPRGSSKTIQLVSGGGEVTLTVSIDPMELEDDDRDFVFDLISKLKNYEKNGGPAKGRAAVPGAAES